MFYLRWIKGLAQGVNKYVKLDVIYTKTYTKSHRSFFQPLPRRLRAIQDALMLTIFFIGPNGVANEAEFNGVVAPIGAASANGIPQIDAGHGVAMASQATKPDGLSGVRIRSRS
ncbi:hypothetical protein [Tateyamaria sp. ANG-S1]|uniref:hypothetical protein n=1 Tax=Tateyamaria sp. ANG-S1 TaxID=1577905 RepID=UPI000580AA2B|nr:hypothetical protein [Tateyamaria sp. ANG-S1]KIC48651.1 hypothetical protein RA29_13125 [Tateyamaria sp. ANG-S1]